MKNKLIFALTFLISVVAIRILMLKYFIDISPIIVAIAFALILRDKFSSFNFKLFKPWSFIAIIIITYLVLFLTIIILTHFNLSELSIHYFTLGIEHAISSRRTCLRNCSTAGDPIIGGCTT